MERGQKGGGLRLFQGTFEHKERVQGRQFISVAQIHDEMPFMYNKAMVPMDYFDLVIENPKYNTTLFAPPNMSVPLADYVAGLHISALIKDGGTLQIGIGSLGDAIVYACQLRHEKNTQCMLSKKNPRILPTSAKIFRNFANFANSANVCKPFGKFLTKK